MVPSMAQTTAAVLLGWAGLRNRQNCFPHPHRSDHSSQEPPLSTTQQEIEGIKKAIAARLPRS